MKIRQGFVSNSSSSSFIIVGKHITYVQPNPKDDDGWDHVNELPDGLQRPKGDKEFMELRNSSYDPDETIIGFGKYDDEYGWNEASFDDVQRWQEKARAYFGSLDGVSVHFGIEGHE